MKKQPYKECIGGAIIWFDYTLQNMDDEFDCSAVVEVSQIESEMFAAMARVDSINDEGSKMCKRFNRMAMYGITEFKRIMDAHRDFMRDIFDETTGEYVSDLFQAVFL